MEESMLEWYFDNFIANDSSKTEEEEEVNEEEEEVNEELSQELRDELDRNFLPDGPIIQDESRQTGSAESRPADSDSSTSLDSSSQNSTAASVVHPSTPVIPERPEALPEIQNIVSTAKLGCQLDLNVIARKALNVKYDPKTYKALTMRIRKPQTTAIIYKSGHIVCLGARSEEQSRIAARRYARIVQKLGFPVRFLDFRIQTIVASCKIFPVNFEQLVLAHHQHCSYEPELFPGLFYKVMPGVSVTIFANGKISVNGAKKEADIYKAFDIVYPVLSCFRRTVN